MIYTDSLRLYSKDQEALHEFAISIGLRSGWYNANAKTPHYDIWDGPLKMAKEKGVSVVKPETLNNIMKFDTSNKPASNVK